MNKRRAAVFAALGALPILLPVLTTGTAAAHGSMETPGSRIYNCYKEGPESPKSAACKAAVQASGAQAFYDWNAVRLADAGGQSKQKIPDGKLCSAGNDEFKGLDLPRADWPSTNLPSGGKYDFQFKATAQHKGGFDLYVTKDGFDPSKPLGWSDLEDKPFASVKDPQVQNGNYVLPATLPTGKTGKHMIYAVWQRSDSPEAFYSCSDVTFGGSGAGAAPQTTDKSSAAPTSSAPSGGGHEHHDSGSQPAAPAPAAPAAGAPAGSAPAETAEVTHTAHQGAGEEKDPTVPLAVGASVVVAAVGAGSYLRRRPAHRKRRTGGTDGRHHVTR